MLLYDFPSGSSVIIMTAANSSDEHGVLSPLLEK